MSYLYFITFIWIFKSRDEEKGQESEKNIEKYWESFEKLLEIIQKMSEISHEISDFFRE